jgi:hypothetical protein
MATQSSNAGTPSNFTDGEQTFSASTPMEATLAEAPAADAPAFEAAVAPAPFESPNVEGPAGEIAWVEPVAAIVEATSALPATVEQIVESTTGAFSASLEFDTGLWSKKSIELWTENASAFFEFAEEIVKARTFEEVVDLQSRFAKARFEAFVRQSKELMDQARSMASLSAAPLCDARKAA